MRCVCVCARVTMPAPSRTSQLPCSLRKGHHRYPTAECLPRRDKGQGCSPLTVSRLLRFSRAPSRAPDALLSSYSSASTRHSIQPRHATAELAQPSPSRVLARSTIPCGRIFPPYSDSPSQLASTPRIGATYAFAPIPVSWQGMQKTHGAGSDSSASKLGKKNVKALESLRRTSWG